MKRAGKAGCGCFIFILIGFLVALGLSVHPLSLKFIGSQFRYEDKIFRSDALFVPRFDEDKNGELYIEAFREYWAGNGRTIYVEEDRMFGASILEPVHRMARLRGIKDEAVKKVNIEGAGLEEVINARRQFAALGCKRVTILVPEYASERFHLLYDSSAKDGRTVYSIRPVAVSYFKMENWWKDRHSSLVLLGELFSIGSFYADRYRHGENPD